jgi:uncharacterized protein (DUF2147 family)
MKIKQQTLLLLIAAIPLLLSNILTNASVVKAEGPKFQATTQIITQKLIAQQSAPSIEGIWQAQDKYRIQIYQNNGVYNGKIIWIAPGKETKDVKNPDKNLRSRDLIGVEMLKGFTYKADKKQWTGGSIYAPDAGRTIKAKMWAGSKNELKVQISMGLFSKTMTLKAVQ